MYRQNDRKAAIIEIQRYLAEYYDNDIPIAPTGVYDKNTKQSVKRFQQSIGENASGIVNLVTFNALYDLYQSQRKLRRVREATDSFMIFPMSPGVSHPSLTHINRTLARILNHYGITHNLRETDFFTPATLNAVRRLRKIFILDEKDQIDEEFYRRILIESDSIEKFTI